MADETGLLRLDDVLEALGHDGVMERYDDDWPAELLAAHDDASCCHDEINRTVSEQTSR